MLLKILSIKPINSIATSIILEKPPGFFYYPGQYIDVKLPIQNYDNRGKVRAFSLSSSPTEDFLMITYKKGISDFKQHLETLKPGDCIEISHPAGTFTLDETEPAIFLTGGVGITPFRSMLKYVLDNKLKTPILLIYSNSTDNFLFENELKTWQKNLPNLHIEFHQTNQGNRLNQTKLATIVGYFVQPIFYLSGSHSIVSDFEKMLLDLKVDELNIRYDRFDGY